MNEIYLWPASMNSSIFCSIYFWHNVRLLAMYWGRNFHWYHFMGALKLVTGRLSLGCRGMEKKIFKIYNNFFIRLRNGKREGSPGCKEPNTAMILFTARKSCNNLHFPDFFLITNIGVFQGEILTLYVLQKAVPALTVLQPPIYH